MLFTIDWSWCMLNSVDQLMLGPQINRVDVTINAINDQLRLKIFIVHD